MKKIFTTLILTACFSMLYADYYQGGYSQGSCSRCNQCPCQWTQGVNQAPQCPQQGQRTQQQQQPAQKQRQQTQQQNNRQQQNQTQQINPLEQGQMQQGSSYRSGFDYHYNH